MYERQEITEAALLAAATGVNANNYKPTEAIAERALAAVTDGKLPELHC
ncbi:MAG: hypothetical protein Rhims3KO_18280 [Hyphomicrobiales bacterium]